MVSKSKAYCFNLTFSKNRKLRSRNKKPRNRILQEYQNRKSSLAETKQALKEKKKAVSESKSQSWFEPVREVLTASVEALKLEPQSDSEEKRKTLEKVGSNLFLKNQKLCLEFKKGYKALEKQGVSRARSVGHNREILKSRGNPSSPLTWRRVRDSNPRSLAGQRFSRPPQSATLPTLLS